MTQAVKSASRPARRHALSKERRRALSIAGVAIGLVAWQVAASTNLVNPGFASSPLRVLSRAVDMGRSGELGPLLLSSAKLFATGFGISLTVGLIGGVLIGWYRTVHAVVDPWVSILYSSPRIAFIPLLIVWFGIGFKTQVVIIVINATFPIMISTAAGVDAVDRQLLRVAQSFGASSWDVLRTVALPGATPSLVSGIRTGMTIALLGTVIAEYFVGLTGVGGMIFNSGLTLDTDAAFVGAVLFAFAGLLLNAGLRRAQLRVDRWRS